MNNPIPINAEELIALRDEPVDEELIATAIAGVVKIARLKGQSLDELTAEVLHDDSILDGVQRRWLSEIVTQAWKSLP
ncbi:MAG: hypothetical protein QNJ54_17230 [Prochloraceae cyanobacterium]|nr:hypothetical protein [Prochloraceae cyanobacterium]